MDYISVDKYPVQYMGQMLPLKRLNKLALSSFLELPLSVLRISRWKLDVCQSTV